MDIKIFVVILMKINIAGVVENSFVDGDGVRFTIFVQGCPHRCKGCQNPATHNFDGGRVVKTEEIIDKFINAPLISGITLSGGEPLCQIKAVTEIAAAAKKYNLSVWCYTGYVYESLYDDRYFTDEEIEKFLNYVDVLVDGPFIESKRDLTMQFCGSRNQRLIDIARTRAEQKIIEWSAG